LPTTEAIGDRSATTAQRRRDFDASLRNLDRPLLGPWCSGSIENRMSLVAPNSARGGGNRIRGRSKQARGDGSADLDYCGIPTLMLAHLKLGTKDSAVETLRVHFHWDADARALVIGHCGPHLDFD
jgi:hypothetical protein